MCVFNFIISEFKIYLTNGVGQVAVGQHHKVILAYTWVNLIITPGTKLENENLWTFKSICTPFESLAGLWNFLWHLIQNVPRSKLSKYIWVAWKNILETILKHTSKSVSCSFMSNSLGLHGLEPSRLLCPWNSPSKNIGMGSHFLLQGIFLTWGSNPGLPHCKQILYRMSHKVVNKSSKMKVQDCEHHGSFPSLLPKQF